MAMLAMDTGPASYADLRTLIDIDPPQYDLDLGGEAANFSHSQYIYEVGTKMV